MKPIRWIRSGLMVGAFALLAAACSGSSPVPVANEVRATPLALPASTAAPRPTAFAASTPAPTAPATPVPAPTATPTPWRFSDTDDADTQYRELLTYIQRAGRPQQIVQVDLDTHRKLSQYTDIDSSLSGFGMTACGLVAVAALGGEDWRSLVDQIAGAAGKYYRPQKGIQPSKYVYALKQVFGAEQVTAIDRGSLGELYRALDADRVVIIDLKVNDHQMIPSAQPPTVAHFARVLGIDVDAQVIYLENTLWGEAYWTVALSDFVEAWRLPETTASIILDPRHAENVSRWAVILSPTLVTNRSN